MAAGIGCRLNIGDSRAFAGIGLSKPGVTPLSIWYEKVVDSHLYAAAAVPTKRFLQD